MSDYLPPVLPDTSHVRMHYAGKDVAVWVPALQAVFSGLFLGLAALAISWLLEYAHPFKLAFVVWLSTQALVWLYLLARWMHLVERIEAALGLDLNRDGWIGAPAPEPVRIEILDRPAQRQQFIDLPAKPEQLLQLASGVVQGVPLAESSWTGAGRPFSKNEFRILRDALLRGGLLALKNDQAPAQGYQLTTPGRAVFKRIAQVDNSPALGAGDRENR